MPSRNAKLGVIYTRAQAQAAAAEADPQFEQRALEAAAEIIDRKSKFNTNGGKTVRDHNGETRGKGSRSRTRARNKLAEQEISRVIR